MAFPYGAVGMGLSALGSIVGGPEMKEQTQYYLIPEQAALIRQLMAQQFAGGTESLGPALKHGQATLAQLMAQRGISPKSGVYASALGNMTANAVSQASQQRFQNLAQLMSASPAMAAGKIQSPDVAGYSWTPGGLRPRGQYQSPYGTYDAMYQSTAPKTSPLRNARWGY